ncbi:cysteine-rich repeat secretory protein 38-like [Asparagus officinalis]|uniref:cysteine-rich repeat secretory protein 38-like n=1 Tax=Asparagus officinalis TaxID=4686 RepID=UPI00098E00A7|nr:cysteine-rich repeat secretory protein 38-like [Asparagus officinalis]
MHSFNVQLSLFSIVSLLLLLVHNASAIDPLFSSCSNSNNHTSNDDPFAKNLNQLMFQLISGSPCTGYSLSSIDQSPYKINGLALCRGDVNRTTCKSCIRNASTQILQLCPYKRQGIILFDECLLRYSDTEFFGQVDDRDQFILVNTGNVSWLQSEFNTQVMQLMGSLKGDVSRSPLFFGTATMRIGQSEMLYGLAQCTRDLSSESCEKCLESAVGELPSCCGGKRGARVVGGSCNVRYELYPFYN